ncbi:MAG: response regulator transcription factor [Candidatus Eremiobacteraeota bacterium]|nr:response regulator transcription factor [Candidatus Eremiobacteraeota bacterium]
MHLLLIEDDREAASYLIKGLTQSGHVVDYAADGGEGLDLALNGSYDVIVLDRMLPIRDGLTILRMLRADHNRTPVLLLTALGDVDDRVEGLQAGGDDYLVKPYAFRELLARVEALGRRVYQEPSQTKLVVEDLEFDLVRRRVTRGGAELNLQPRELALLEVLMRNSGQVVTRTMLLERVWDIHFNPQSNVIDTQVSRLRTKIDRGFERQLLQTVRGVGYRLSAAVPR